MRKLQKDDIDRIVNHLVGNADTISHIGEISAILRLFNDNPNINKPKLALAQEALAEYLNNTLSDVITPPKLEGSAKFITTVQWGKLYHDFPRTALIQSMKSEIIFEFHTKFDSWLELTSFTELHVEGTYIHFINGHTTYLQIRDNFQTINGKKRPLYSFWCYSCHDWTHTSQYDKNYQHLTFPVSCSHCKTEICRISHTPTLETLTAIDGVELTPS